MLWDTIRGLNMTAWRRICALATNLSLALLLSTTVNATDGIDLDGSWQGSVQVGQYDPLALVIHFERQNDGLHATIDIPSQFMLGIPVSSISLRNNQLLLRIPEIQAEFYGALQFGRDPELVRSIVGDWSQSGEHVPLRLHRREAQSDSAAR